jgi:hypothetical protein
MLMPSPHREAHDGNIARCLQTGEKHIIGIHRQTVARRKNENVFPVDLSVNEIPQLKLFTGIHRDLTDRKRLAADNVIAFVLVRHLAPGHHTLIVELLGRHTTMAVVEAVNDHAGTGSSPDKTKYTGSTAIHAVITVDLPNLHDDVHFE